MPVGGFLEDASLWLADATKPKPRFDPRGGYQVTRKNPQNGFDQIQVPDPDYPGRAIWVDALWNPLRDLMEPVDPKYRPKEADYYSMSSIMRNQFAGSDGVDFSGQFNLGVPGLAPVTSAGTSLQLPGPSSQSDSGGVWLVVGAVVILFLLSR